MARRKDGRLEKTITIDGQRIHVYGHTQAEIKQKIEAIYQDYHDGFLGIDKDTRFGEYAEHWLAITLEGKSFNTAQQYTRYTRFLCKHFGDVRLVDIKRSHIESVLMDYSPSVRIKMLNIAKAVFALAVDDGVLKGNPAINIKPPRWEKKKRDRFTEAEIDMIKNTPLDPRERLAIDLLFYTGIRHGELMGLSRKSIGDGIIRITEQSQLENNVTVIKKPKTKGSVRDIPIPKWLEEEIRAYMKTVPYIYIFEDVRRKRVFDTFWKHILVKFSMYRYPNFKVKTFHHLTPKDLPVNISPHWFRHNYASMLHDNGVDILVAQRLLGHSNVTTTLEIYTHLDKDGEKDKFEAVRSIFEKAM